MNIRRFELTPGPYCTCPRVWHATIPPHCPVHNPLNLNSGWHSYSLTTTTTTRPAPKSKTPALRAEDV